MSLLFPGQTLLVAPVDDPADEQLAAVESVSQTGISLELEGVYGVGCVLSVGPLRVRVQFVASVAVGRWRLDCEHVL